MCTGIQERERAHQSSTRSRVAVTRRTLAELRVLTGPGGVTRDVGEDADDTEVGQLRHRALWGEEGLSVPPGAWLGTSELQASSPTCAESTCAPPSRPQEGATPGSLSTYVRLEGPVGKSGRTRAEARRPRARCEAAGTSTAPPSCRDGPGRRPCYLFVLRPSQTSVPLVITPPSEGGCCLHPTEGDSAQRA